MTALRAEEALRIHVERAEALAEAVNGERGTHRCSDCILFERVAALATPSTEGLHWDGAICMGLACSNAEHHPHCATPSTEGLRECHPGCSQCRILEELDTPTEHPAGLEPAARQRLIDRYGIAAVVDFEAMFRDSAIARQARRSALSDRPTETGEQPITADKRCLHGVDHSEECPECGFGFIEARDRPTETGEQG